MPTRGNTDDRVLQIWLQVQTPRPPKHVYLDTC